MSNPETQQFTIGEPKDYLGGHVAIGIVTLLEAAIPITLYYAWMHPRIETWVSNTWYKNSWAAAAYGHFITFLIPFIFWCLSFIAKNTMFFTKNMLMWCASTTILWTRVDIITIQMLAQLTTSSTEL